MESIVERARDFAFRMHGDQDHGCLKIKDHLEDVVNNVEIHYGKTHAPVSISYEQALASAYLHDVLEDTSATYSDIAAISPAVANTVSRLTDSSGRNRKDRHLRTYWRIRQCPVATLIKLCDRRHNQARSLKHGERWIAMYEREFDYFAFALYNPHDYKDLWDELFDQQRAMKKAMEF